MLFFDIQFKQRTFQTTLHYLCENILENEIKMVSSSVKKFEFVLEREGMYSKKRQVIATYSNPTKLPTKTCK